MLGLGQMGRKITELLIKANFEVTVWNRTKKSPNEFPGATFNDTPTHAIANSPVSIICVLDNTAVFSILKSAGKLEGKIIINLTTGGPDEVSDIQAFVTSQGGQYINGAIQVAPDQMGFDNTTILLAGSQQAFDRSKQLLRVLGGNLRFFGESASASSAVDLATLTWLYGSYVGLIYAVKLCKEYKLDLHEVGNVIAEVAPGYIEFFKHQVDTINRNDFRITQSPLSISVPATRRVADTFRNLNVVQEFPESIARILENADRQNLGNEEAAAIIKVIERPQEFK